MNDTVARLLAIFTVALLLLSLVDAFVWRTTYESIRTGDPFWYWSHVSLIARAPLALLMLGFVSAWIFLHRMTGWLRVFRWWAVLILSSACCIFSLIAPLGSVTNLARHHTSASNDGTRYHLYHQFEGIADQTCETVLVQCDALGLRCQYVDRWQVSPLCLAENTPIGFRYTDDETLQVVINHAEIVFEE